MNIRVRAGDAGSARAELVVLPLAVGEEDGRTVRAFARSRGGTGLRRAIAATRFRGRESQVASIPLADGRRRTLCLVGLGEPGAIDVDAWRRAAGRGRKAADAAGAKSVAIAVDERAGDRAHLVALAEGFRLAGYRFDKYKSSPDAPPPIEDLILVAPSPPPAGALTPDWKMLDAMLEAVETVRDLVNEPAAAKTPKHLAALAKRIGEEAGIAVEVWDRKRIEAERMVGLAAVARGSEEDPRLIRMRYRGSEARRRVALVGKGVTFDAGGLSLKSPKAMETMKHDMAGGATVIAVMAALGHLRPPIEVEGFIPATENLPSGTAQKPGDVLRLRNGKTVEVLNTDAEGRLILADALALAAAGKPDAVIDVATLTGACVVALGPQVAGIFGNHQPLVDCLIAIGRETGDSLWQLPLVREYREDLKSTVADLKNVGGSNGGSITAALFLEEFVGNVHWAHLDIAGPAFAERDLPYTPKGGTGFGVRTLVRYLLETAREESRGTRHPPAKRRRSASHRSRS